MKKLVLDSDLFPNFKKWFDATVQEVTNEIMESKTCFDEHGILDFEKAQELLTQRVAEYVGWPVSRSGIRAFFVLDFEDHQDQEMLAIRLKLN